MKLNPKENRINKEVLKGEENQAPPLNRPFPYEVISFDHAEFETMADYRPREPEDVKT